MRTSGKQGSPAKAEFQNYDTKELPTRKALMNLAKSKKTINDYSKAAPQINDYPPSTD